jgi:hypothetical protein
MSEWTGTQPSCGTIFTIISLGGDCEAIDEACRKSLRQYNVA